MSLPATKKQTAEKPAPGSVIDPLNKDDKAADIDRQLRLLGVFEAFRQGRLPDNAQIDSTLKYVLNHSPVEVEKLSPEGRKLISDTKDIIETARLMVSQKNADELFQNFVWHTRDVDTDRMKRDPKDLVPANSNIDTGDDKQQAAYHLRTLLNLVMTNSEVRKLLSDFGFIGRELLAKAATKVAEGIRPTEDQLAGIDHAAPQDQFITTGGRPAGSQETPVLEARVPGTDHVVSHDPNQPNAEISANGQVGSAGQVYDEQRERLGGVKETAQGHLNDVQGQIADQNADPEVKKQGLKDKMKDLTNGLMDRIPQDHKDRAGDQYDRGKTFMLEEYFPEERRDQFIYRGKKVIIECQKHSDYQASLKWLLDALETYRGHGKETLKNAGSHGQGVTSDPVLRQATTDLRTLLERFANGRSIDGILDAINALYANADRDEELRDWFKSVNSYTRKVLLEAGYVLEPLCNTHGKEIRESGRRFYDDKYKDHFDNLFNNISDFFEQMGEDPLNKRFGEDWARLTKHLLFDSEGSLKFKPALWGDIRKVILPTLIDQVGYIPIPRIEYTDDSFDLVIENLTLSGKNLFPNIVTLEAKNYFKFSPYNIIGDASSHDITLHFSQIQADMRDVAFYFRKKTGIPKLSDSGLADVVVGGEGVSVTAHIVSSSKDKTSVFNVKSINVKVDSLKFSIRDSKHDFLYKTLKPLATGLVKKQIQKAIHDGVRTGLEYVDGQLVAVRDRMEVAQAQEGSDGVEAKSRMQVLQEMFQRKKEESESTASTKTRDSQFKVVTKRDSSILPDTSHPSGWVNRGSDRVEAASKGNDWRSEAFTIV